MNGGNKSIAALRYVHGIIQIQVREQVLPMVGGLAEPGSLALTAHQLQQERFPTFRPPLPQLTASRETHPLKMFMGL